MCGLGRTYAETLALSHPELPIMAADERQDFDSWTSLISQVEQSSPVGTVHSIQLCLSSLPCFVESLTCCFFSRRRTTSPAYRRCTTPSCRPSPCAMATGSGTPSTRPGWPPLVRRWRCTREGSSPLPTRCTSGIVTAVLRRLCTRTQMIFVGKCFWFFGIG